MELDIGDPFYRLAVIVAAKVTCNGKVYWYFATAHHADKSTNWWKGGNFTEIEFQEEIVFFLGRTRAKMVTVVPHPIRESCGRCQKKSHSHILIRSFHTVL